MLNSEDRLRDQAITSLKKKREFQVHFLAFVLVNAMLVVIWALSNDRGFFWPIFPILGWGLGLAFHAREVYARPPSESSIEREMDRLRRAR